MPVVYGLGSHEHTNEPDTLGGKYAKEIYIYGNRLVKEVYFTCDLGSRFT